MLSLDQQKEYEVVYNFEYWLSNLMKNCAQYTYALHEMSSMTITHIEVNATGENHHT